MSIFNFEAIQFLVLFLIVYGRKMVRKKIFNILQFSFEKLIVDVGNFQNLFKQLDGVRLFFSSHFHEGQTLERGVCIHVFQAKHEEPFVI